ncbi:MAG TPA: DUF4388 domain-containing protein [Thermoanaerobaculia bacterium]|nr:DUF4388 domain-containing protein [Thermoanaerobaculia bacterium]
MSSFEGTLESGQLLDILRSISGRAASGLLSVQGEPDLVSLTFLDGAIVAADAMNRPAEDVLAGVLDSRGLLGPADFAAAVEPALGTGRLASEVLLELRKVPRDDLLDAVREQTYGQVVRLLRWENGNFNWTEDVESPFQEGMSPISVAEALVRSTEELGVEGPLSTGLPDLDAAYEATSAASGYRVVGRDGDWIDRPTPGEPVWLTPDEEMLLELIRQGIPGIRLVEKTGWGRYRVELALFQLLALGLVATGAWEEEDETGAIADHTSARVLAAAVPSVFESGQVDELASDVSNFALDGDLTSPPAVAPAPVVEPSAELELSADLESAAMGARPKAKRTALAQVTSLWAARALALGLVGLLVTLLLVQAERPALLLPFPWQMDARARLERHQTLSRYLKIDRAVRTYYLLYGRPPESLATLSVLELLEPADLYDPLGRWLSYTGRETGYVVQPVDGGEVVPGSELAADSRADFFLNPKFVDLPEQRPDPLVLLD